MRALAGPSPSGLSVRAIAGTYVVLLAFNCDDAYCTGLLGFAIKRTDHRDQETIWLRGLKKFDLPGSDAGDSVTTRRHPIQKFHWGDYTAQPGRSYTYEVHAMRGSKMALVDDDFVAIDVRCEVPEKVGTTGHAVHFNRSAAASQAFARRFPSMPPGAPGARGADQWRRRGSASRLSSAAWADDERPPAPKGQRPAKRSL